MRLIDADALMRIYQEVLCPHVSCVDCSLLMNDGNCRFETMIREALAIDAVPATVQEWISVDERLPQNFVSVLGHMTDAGEFPQVRECYTVGNAFFFPALDDVHPVSHWCEMPQPPKGE